MIKYIFWDFNGTILDDRVLCWKLLNKLLKSEKKKSVSFEEYLEIFGFPIKEYYLRAGIEFKYRTFEEMSNWFILKYQPLSLKQSLYKGVKETLKILNEMKIKNICLSASQEDNLKEQLKHYQIDNYFVKILGTNNILALGKKEIAQKYIIDNKIKSSECILIGDTDADYELAKDLNVLPVLFTNGHQSKKKLKSLNALTIDNIKDLLKIIERRTIR